MQEGGDLYKTAQDVLGPLDALKAMEEQVLPLAALT